MEEKIKTSLFGYSKKSVEQLQSEYEDKIKLLSEENSRITEQSRISAENEKSKIDSLNKENADLKSRLEKTMTELEQTTKELFEIKKMSSDYLIKQESISNNSKLITQDIISDSYEFEELIKSLKACNEEMKNYCDKAENIYNDTFIKIAEFILNASKDNNNPDNSGNSHIIA